MDAFHVDIEIGDQEGHRHDRLEALVGTGATYLSVPRPRLDALGIVPHTRDFFVLADGRRVEREIGHAWIKVGTRSAITLVVFTDSHSPVSAGRLRPRWSATRARSCWS